MQSLPILIATFIGLALFALVGGLLCRSRSIADIVERFCFDDALYARTLLITGVPIGLLGWLAARHPLTIIQEVGLVLTVISTVIYAAVPVFVLRGFVAKRAAERVPQ